MQVFIGLRRSRRQYQSLESGHFRFEDINLSIDKEQYSTGCGVGLCLTVLLLTLQVCQTISECH